MDRLTRMETHIAKHPHDWQTAVSYMKLRSKKISNSIKRQKNLERKKVARFKETG